MTEAYCRDCMEAMREYPDKYFDLAVVDPPYGGGSQSVHVERERELRGGTADFEHRRRSRFGGLFDGYHLGGANRRDMGNSLQGDARGYL